MNSKNTVDKGITLDSILSILENRFNESRIIRNFSDFDEVKDRLTTANLEVILKMELSGGEPDIIHFEKENNKYWVVDTSKESPIGRRSLCYDMAAYNSRKKAKPTSSAEKMAKDIGIDLLDEYEYKFLQSIGDFDNKTSSWIKTPDEVRKLGGAIFGDKRYNRVFIYHNGCESYYASRGFRGKIEI